MATRFFPAAVLKDPNGAYFIQALDIEEAFTQGDTIEHALEMAQDALNLVIETYLEDGKEVPSPTPLDQARAPAFPAEYGTFVGIFPVQATLPGKKIRVSVNLDDELVKQIDAVAGNYGRSEWIEGAARMRLRSDTMPSFDLKAQGKPLTPSTGMLRKYKSVAITTDAAGKIIRPKKVRVYRKVRKISA